MESSIDRLLGFGRFSQLDFRPISISFGEIPSMPDLQIVICKSLETDGCFRGS